MTAENEREAIVALREALKPFVDGYSHTLVFLSTREKMHPCGLELYKEDVERAKSALENGR